MFAFTSEDDTLALPLSGRDPLGTQVIWQRRARDIVPALTGASRQVEGFQILITALAWWPTFAVQHKRPQKDLHNFFLLIEQIFARACKMNATDWRLPGSRRLKDAQERDLWIGLDGRRDFLVNSPLTNGTWGIYRNPAETAGLVDASGRVPSVLAKQVLSSTEVVRTMFGPIATSLADPKQRITVAQRSSKKISQLARIVERPPQRSYFRNKLVCPANSPVTTALAELASEQNDETIDKLLARALQRLPLFEQPLQDVSHCERYITSLDLVFEWLGSHPGCTLKELAEKLPMHLTALRGAQSRFKSSGKYEGLSANRHSALASFSLDTSASLIENVIEHHRLISASRGTTPLISWSDTRKLESVVATEPTEDQQIDVRHVWRNSYYLDSLRQLAVRTARRLP
ncbi:hypothetical protein ACIGHN_11595 [Acidovorax sp. NPDC077693]|uniref:hypothetical protein n=1 Tax=unclassified Acidovorax TaxID=2684926 RepID=UPI0037C8A8C0